MYLPKDFIATSEGLVFAVVAEGLEAGKVLCFLRYYDTHQSHALKLAASAEQPAITAKRWQKQDTLAANQLLAERFPQYLHHSQRLDAACHAVDVTNIKRHFQPRQWVQTLMQTPPTDPVLQDCYVLLQLLEQQGIDLALLGITGSLLLNAQHSDSDIDLVVYDPVVFQQIRQLIPKQIAQHSWLQDLTANDWQEAYQRRACDLSFAEYYWHEGRKYNKFLVNSRKVDVSLLTKTDDFAAQHYKKLGHCVLRCQVTNADQAYHYPAVFDVIADTIIQVVCFTATYIGQAEVGEWIEVAGQLEEDAQGKCRLVVGTTREARGEYIKVLAAHA